MEKLGVSQLLVQKPLKGFYTTSLDNGLEVIRPLTDRLTTKLPSRYINKSTHIRYERDDIIEIYT